MEKVKIAILNGIVLYKNNIPDIQNNNHIRLKLFSAFLSVEN
jgi:hypothetical protein